MFTLESVTLLINQYLPEPEAGLLAGILFGVQADMDRELYQALVNTGTLHIVALSGANISILTGLIGSTLLKLRFSTRLSGLISICIIIGFIFFVGPSPSVVRAAIMSCLSILAVVFGRQLWSFWSWVITVSLMLALSPRLATDISFQLSAGATLGIIMFGQKVVRIAKKTEIKEIKEMTETDKNFIGLYNLKNSSHISHLSLSSHSSLLYRLSHLSLLSLLSRLSHISLLSRLSQAVSDDLRLTLAAQVFTIPVTLYYFRRISLISPVPNLLIGWILPPLTGLGYSTVIIGTFIRPLGQVMAWFAYIPLAFIIGVIALFSKFPLAAVGY